MLRINEQINVSRYLGDCPAINRQSLITQGVWTKKPAADPSFGSGQRVCETMKPFAVARQSGTKSWSKSDGPQRWNLAFPDVRDRPRRGQDVTSAKRSLRVCAWSELCSKAAPIAGCPGFARRRVSPERDRRLENVKSERLVPIGTYSFAWNGPESVPD